MNKNTFFNILLTIIVTALTSSCIMTTASTGLIYDVWDGSETPIDSDFIIDSAAKFAWLVKQTTTSGNTYTLVVNIDLENRDLAPVSGGFNGTFEGEGHTIKGLKLTNRQNTGLFSEIKGTSGNPAKVQNIKIVLADGTLTSSTVQSAGVLAGHAENAKITSVTVSATNGAKLAIRSGCMDLYVGGIIGNSYSNVTISNSSSNVAIVTTSDDPSSQVHAGGITGEINNSIIKSCYAKGNVEASGITTRAGGIAGNGHFGTTAEINLCYYTTGTVTAISNGTTGSYAAYAGGIIGQNYDVTTRCYSTGTVEATSDYNNTFAGGISGELFDGTIELCYATGNITAHSLPFMARAGGILGHNNIGTSVMDCIFLRGNINASGANPFAGNIAGDTNVAYTNNNTAASVGINRNPTSGDTDVHNGNLDTYDNLLQKVTTSAFGSSAFGWSDFDWRFTTGQHPKLEWE